MRLACADDRGKADLRRPEGQPITFVNHMYCTKAIGSRQPAARVPPRRGGAALPYHGVESHERIVSDIPVGPPGGGRRLGHRLRPVSYTHLRAHETDSYLVCRLLL